MENLRVIDQDGNRQDYATEFVPRIGERVILTFGTGGQPIRPHYFRVKDVAYHLDNPVKTQATILVDEEANPELWPE